MAVRTFRVDEANEVLPEVRRVTERVVELTTAMPELADELRIAEYRAGRAVATPADRSRLSEAMRRQRSAEEELIEAAGRLDDLGVELKDPTTGLVDFLSYQGDELVELCWQLGEDEVGYWHRIGEGYAGRKPIRARR